jgi:hypothetical protein
MSAPLDPTPSPGRWSAYAPYFPLPLVAGAALLAFLILLTPNLLSTGSPSAGSIQSQAELLVDRAPNGGNETHLYLRGLGIVRYQELVLQWAPFPAGAPPSNPSAVTWSNRSNSSGALEVEGATDADAFLVNATATFVDATGAGVVYAATFAFAWSGGDLVTTPYGAAAGASPTPPSQLPLVLLLVQGPYPGGP